MGEHEVKASESAELRAFTQALLEDLRALAQLEAEGRIESGVRRIGAEQEMFLIDADGQAAPCGDAVLAELPAESFAPELALFNLEANLQPRTLAATCLGDMERELQELIGQAARAAEAHGARVLLCGILPTLRQADLTLEQMVPSPRFHALNRVMTELSGGRFRTLIKGLDELRVTHDNVMLEACNTSFQVHFQVGPEEFASLYNLAQAVTGPVLAVSVNSPLFLQHRLWHETRVALFQQSLDVRNPTQRERGVRQRVTFGKRWVERSVLEIFKEDATRFRALLASDLGEGSLSLLERGEVPPLKALCLHNGTIYRWNRPCYGVKDGRAHLRIENRALPAGPTLLDEVANAAFYFGLMVALGEEVGDVARAMEFDHVKQNFLAAARYGLSAQFRWVGGRETPARELILEELLPQARAGLASKGIEPADVDRYLGVVEERVRRGVTGAQWALDSLAGLRGTTTCDQACRAIVAATYEEQSCGRPVHEWPPARLDEARGWRRSFYRTVDQVMTRDVFTVHPEDVVDLAASLMDWEHLRRVPVEDDDGQLVGILTQRGLMRLLIHGQHGDVEPVAVREVMRADPVTIHSGATTLEAIARMREHRVGCLPVVEDGRLVGIVTEHDFIEAAARLLGDALGDGGVGGNGATAEESA